LHAETEILQEYSLPPHSGLKTEINIGIGTKAERLPLTPKPEKAGQHNFGQAVNLCPDHERQEAGSLRLPNAKGSGAAFHFGEKRRESLLRMVVKIGVSGIAGLAGTMDKTKQIGVINGESDIGGKKVCKRAIGYRDGLATLLQKLVPMDMTACSNACRSGK